MSYGILFSKLLWHAARKKSYSDRENVSKFETEGPEFAKVLRSLEQSNWILKGHYNFWKRMLF